MGEPLLKTEDVDAGYGGAIVLRGVTTVVHDQEIVCIIGPNGSGKSTLFKTIMGYLRPWRGRIVFGGEDLTGLEPHQIVQKGLNCVMQGRSVFANMMVRENLELGGYTLSPTERRRRLVAIVDSFPPLQPHLDRKAGLLSSGQQRMLEIARALVLAPRLLLLDEPTLGLSPKMASEVLDVVVRLRTVGQTVMIIEQNARRALHISTRAYVLDRGITRFEDSGVNILKNDDVRRLYLGMS